MKVPGLNWTTCPAGQLSSLAWIACESSLPLGEIVAQTVVRFGIPPTDVRPGFQGNARSEGRIPLVEDGGGPTTMLSAIVLLPAAREVESVTWTVKLKVPAAPGVPEICPVDALRLRPVGNDPALTLHAYGRVPPLATSAVP
jgi:hypothetical protein